MKKLITCSLLFCVSSLALASVTVYLPISQPVIAPHAFSAVSLEPLKSHLVYNIRCSVDSTLHLAPLKLTTPSHPGISHSYAINCVSTGSEMIAAKGNNIIEVFNYVYFDGRYGPETLGLQNLSNDGTLTIQDCYAYTPFDQ